MGNAEMQQHVLAPSSEVAAQSTTTAATLLISAALDVASALELAVVWHHPCRALLPPPLFLFHPAAPPPDHHPRQQLLPRQRLVRPLLRRLFQPTSVLVDGVDQMGMARLVWVVLSGDAAPAMDGVVMGRMTTVGCRGAASHSSGHAISNGFMQSAAKSKELVRGGSDHQGRAQRLYI